MNIHAAGHSQNVLCHFVRLKIAGTANEFELRRGRPRRQLLNGCNRLFEIGNAHPRRGTFFTPFAFQAGTVLWEIAFWGPWHEPCLLKVGAANQELFGSKQQY
jgi:hypothetical protein